MKRFEWIFASQDSVQGENSEKLEVDHPLNESAMLLRPQGLQNQTNMAPKLVKRKKKSTEEAKREQRVPWEPSRPTYHQWTKETLLTQILLSSLYYEVYTVC